MGGNGGENTAAGSSPRAGSNQTHKQFNRRICQKNDLKDEVQKVRKEFVDQEKAELETGRAIRQAYVAMYDNDRNDFKEITREISTLVSRSTDPVEATTKTLNELETKFGLGPELAKMRAELETSTAENIKNFDEKATSMAVLLKR